MRKIKQFLLSLMGKGWLWGTGTVSYGFKESVYEIKQNPTGNPILDRWITLEQKEAEAKLIAEAEDRFVKQLEEFERNGCSLETPKLTEIDFMCAWLMITGLLPHECDVVFKGNHSYGFDRIESTCDGRLHRFPTVVIYTKLNNKYIGEYAHANSVSEFIYEHGMENLEWMFKSVTYDV